MDTIQPGTVVQVCTFRESFTGTVMADKDNSPEKVAVMLTKRPYKRLKPRMVTAKVSLGADVNNLSHDSYHLVKIEQPAREVYEDEDDDE